jgi:hypothetical protein
MRYTSYYTIQELDYKAIELKMLQENISEELKLNIKKLIDDHKALIESRKKIIKAQTESAFKLFDDSSVMPSTQNAENVIPPTNLSDKEKKEPKKKKRVKSGKNKLPEGEVFHHSLSEEEKTCPCCNNKMHKHTDRKKTTVLAIPMLKTETHILESYRCPSCEEVKIAPDPLENQCIGRYHFSAVSSLLTLRYQCGMASYRLEKMSDAFGIQIANSTQWYIAENAATILRPFVLSLEKEAANAPVQHVDDTHNIILSLVKDIEAEQEQAFLNGKDPKTVRSGIHTTNLTGVFPEGQIILYKTGLHHSGEILANIFEKRTLEEQLIIMADAASANTSKIDFGENPNVQMANCNSHAVRKFQEIADKDAEVAKTNRIKEYKESEFLAYFLIRYKIIFGNDKKAKDMEPNERLIFHREQSLPLMLEMKKRAEEALAQKLLEPNGDMGKVYKYFLKHFPELTAFCHLKGAPICNNLSERMLKRIILHRKNSLFFKTEVGAAVADIITSILFTAKENGLNSTDYLRDLLTYENLWKENPKNWLPWNYSNTIQKIKNSTLSK